MSSKYLSINNPKDLLYHIDNHVQNENNKKKFGEVFTPMSLVNEMLDKLPVHVWTDPNLKWLDPCVGMGNFMIAVYLRLIESLTIIKDINKRKKHILENMLYMVELNKKNVYITKQIFDINNGYKLNIACADSLTMNYLKRFRTDTFDIIVGNPPYQDNQVNKGTKRGGGDLLWNKFVIKSLELLIEKGYLLFVHPAGWRKPESEKSKYKNMFKLMTEENQMLYLEIHDTGDGMKMFGCGTRYDWYIIEKREKYKNTIVVGEDKKCVKLNLSLWKFLPNCYFVIIQNLIINIANEKCVDILFSRGNYGSDRKWVSSKKTKEYKYELIHSTPKNGTRYMYSSRNDNGFFGVPKIIFGESGIYNAIIDVEGNYGMSQGAMAIKISDRREGENIKKFIEGEAFKKILNACSWSNFRIDWRLFTYFRHDFYFDK